MPRDLPFDAATAPEARWWRHLEDPSRGRLVECRLCPHFCRLSEGQTGRCLARGVVQGRLRALTWGQAASIAMDPVEKKPLRGFLPGTMTLSMGSVGCNLRCRFCQNHTISHPAHGEWPRTHLVTPAEFVALALQQGAPSVAFTYNEPITFAEYVVEAARLAHASGLKTIAVSAGHISSEAREEFFENIDAANIDLKFFNPDSYRHYSGVERDAIFDTLRFLRHRTRVWLEITTLVIPNVNDSPGEIRQIAEWIRDELGRDTPWHLTPFHGAYLMDDHPATTTDTLRRCRAIAREVLG